MHRFTFALSLALMASAPMACGDDDTTSPAACTTTCETPPAAACADGDTLRVHASPGTCSAETCSYPSVEVDCPSGCVEVAGVGRCAGDPCDGVTCDAPPSACHEPVGTCDNAVCSYAVRVDASCDDGNGCTSGDACSAAGTCVGVAVACQVAPPSTCEGNTLVAYSANGRCEDGGCVYDATQVACPDGCADGRCLGDPCAGVTCATPPSGCHATLGTCRDGVCDYALEDGAPCDDANACTTGDACGGGLCGGAPKVCATPPAPTCGDATTLIGRAPNGTCGAGECTYANVPTTCQFGCVEVSGVGRCEGDPCAGVVCDEPSLAECKDPQTLEIPAAAGTCGNGTCTYTTTLLTCPHGCEAGAPSAPARCRPPTGLVIAEVRYDSQGFPDTDSFVEVHGAAGTVLDGVTLVGVNGNGAADYATIALSGTLDQSGRFVVAHPSASPDLAAVADLLDAKVDFQNGPDSVQLRYGNIVLDALAYGTFGDNDIARGEGAAHPGHSVGESLSRDEADTDTNVNAQDFTAGLATPGLPTLPPEVAPEVAILCPTSGNTGESLSFDASASTGDIAAFTFDFGDGTTAVETTDRTASHVFTAEGSYQVTVSAESPGGQVDTATCGVAIENAEAPVVYTAATQCFSNGVSYLYHVISDPVPPETDVKLTVQYSGVSTYGTRPYTIQIQTGANTWSTIANTNDSKVATQTQNFVIDRAEVQAAITAMGWLRFRWSYLTNGATGNCLALTVTYNCQACFECPPGELDLGIGCQPIQSPYDYTMLEHPLGRCSSSNQTIEFPGSPVATGDGSLTVQSLGCGNASSRMSIFTNNSGWVELGTGSAGNCFYGSASYTVPRAYLAQAVNSENRIRFSWSLTDTCASGTGCSNSNDPCVKNARLTYPR